MTIYHLLNDFSGSTSIINDILEYNSGFKVVTSNTKGRIPNTRIIKYNTYNYSKSFLLKTFQLLKVYLSTLADVYRSNDEVVFSTIIYAPVALLSRRQGVKIYLMELQHGPKLVFNALILLLRLTNVNVILLSKSMNNFFKFKDPQIAYPSLRKEFSIIQNSSLNNRQVKSILFIGSFKEYKGWPMFVELSNKVKEYDFTMLISHQLEYNPKITGFKGNILYNVSNVAKIIMDHDIVVNLSNPTQWKETFGLTIVEAMIFSKIVIAPAHGAFPEYISNGRNGFLFQDYKSDEIIELLQRIKRLNIDKYIQITREAFITAEKFKFENQQPVILEVINDKN